MPIVALMPLSPKVGAVLVSFWVMGLLVCPGAMQAQVTPTPVSTTQPAAPMPKKAGPMQKVASKSPARTIVEGNPEQMPVGIRRALPSLGEAAAQLHKASHDSSQAYKLLAQLIKHTGHRLTGSVNGAAASSFMANAARKLGLQVQLQPFKVEAWARQEASLEVVPPGSDNFAPISCVSLAQTPLFSDVTAPLLDAGNGLPEDWQRLGPLVRGKVVIFNIGVVSKPGEPTPGPNLHRSEKVSLASQAGAAACILVNNAPGDILLTGTASATGALTKIPALCVSQNSGIMLREWLGQERLLAVLTVRNSLNQTTVYNVVATLPGTDLAAEEIVIGCHLDSWDLANGACDNGVGSAAVYEAARLLRQLRYPLRRSVRFVWFMGEEQGLLGSKHYVKQLGEAGRRRTKYMVNLDMAYQSKGLNLHGKQDAIHWADSLGRYLHAHDTLFLNKNENKAHLHSDHQPFMLQGIPTMAPNAQWSAEALHCYHADCDKLDWVNTDGLDRTARLAALALFSLATTDVMPASPLDAAATKLFLEQQGLKEALKIRGEW